MISSTQEVHHSITNAENLINLNRNGETIAKELGRPGKVNPGERIRVYVEPSHVIAKPE